MLTGARRRSREQTSIGLAREAPILSNAWPGPPPSQLVLGLAIRTRFGNRVVPPVKGRRLNLGTYRCSALTFKLGECGNDQGTDCPVVHDQQPVFI